MKHAPVYLIYSCSPRKPSASLLQIAIAVLGRKFLEGYSQSSSKFSVSTSCFDGFLISGLGLLGVSSG